MTKKTIEIERRWLLSNNPLDIYQMGVTYETFTQHYLKDGSRLRRIRDIIGNVRFEHIVKNKIGNTSNVEIDLNISNDEVSAKLKTSVRHISKRRWKKDGWEIDEFVGKRLVIAEYEIKSIDQEVIIPNWLQPYVIIEITGMEQFSNYNLSTLK